MDRIDIEKRSVIATGQSSCCTTDTLPPLDPVLLAEFGIGKRQYTPPLPGQILPISSRPYSITPSFVEQEVCASDHQRKTSSNSGVTSFSAFTTTPPETKIFNNSSNQGFCSYHKRCSNALSITTALPLHYGLLLKILLITGILIPPIWIICGSISYFIIRKHLDDLEADEYLLGITTTTGNDNVPSPIWSWNTVQKFGTIKFWMWLSEFLAMFTLFELCTLLAIALSLIIN